MMLLYSDVSAAATAAIATLEQIGVTACFVGGMACKLYGNDRIPGVRALSLSELVLLFVVGTFAYRESVSRTSISCVLGRDGIKRS